jgi:hypothetical protein
MGTQETTKGTKKKMSDRYQKPKQRFIKCYEILAGLHFFHQDPGWEPKGQLKGRNKKMSGR